MGASATSAFRPMHTHAATEAMLAESSVAWTSLRNGFYASTVPQLIGDAVNTGVIEAPADGVVAWTAHADLAVAAAHILVNEGRFDGPTPSLTATQTHDLADVAVMLTKATGRLMKRRIIDDAEEERRLAGYGLPPAVIDITLGIYRAARAGEFSSTNPTLANLIGRSPVTLNKCVTTERL